MAEGVGCASAVVAGCCNSISLRCEKAFRNCCREDASFCLAVLDRVICVDDMIQANRWLKTIHKFS